MNDVDPPTVTDRLDVKAAFIQARRKLAVMVYNVTEEVKEMQNTVPCTIIETTEEKKT